MITNVFRGTVVCEDRGGRNDGSGRWFRRNIRGLQIVTRGKFELLIDGMRDDWGVALLNRGLEVVEIRHELVFTLSDIV